MNICFHPLLDLIICYTSVPIFECLFSSMVSRSWCGEHQIFPLELKSLTTKKILVIHESNFVSLKLSQVAIVSVHFKKIYSWFLTYFMSWITLYFGFINNVNYVSNTEIFETLRNMQKKYEDKITHKFYYQKIYIVLYNYLYGNICYNNST